MTEAKKNKTRENLKAGINTEMDCQMVCNNVIISVNYKCKKLFILFFIMVMQTIAYSQVSFDANFESGNINTVSTLKQALTSLQTFVFAI